MPKKEAFFSLRGEVGAEVVLDLPWFMVPELLPVIPDFGSELVGAGGAGVGVGAGDGVATGGGLGVLGLSIWLLALDSDGDLSLSSARSWALKCNEKKNWFDEFSDKSGNAICWGLDSYF